MKVRGRRVEQLQIAYSMLWLNKVSMLQMALEEDPRELASKREAAAKEVS